MGLGVVMTPASHMFAAVLYVYRREYRVTIKHAPCVYRYADWSLTMALQMIEFHGILCLYLIKMATSGIAWRKNRNSSSGNSSTMGEDGVIRTHTEYGQPTVSVPIATLRTEFELPRACVMKQKGTA